MTCLICLDKFENSKMVQLQPCLHLMCSDCFLIFPAKLKTNKCPLCTQPILTYGHNKDCFESLLSKQSAEVTELELIGETLDHQFFNEELKKILQLTTLLVNQRELKHRGGYYKESLMLQQIKQQVQELQWRCQTLELFDANKRLIEIHQMHETLLKIQSGTVDKEDLKVFGVEDEQEEEEKERCENNFVIQVSTK